MMQVNVNCEMTGYWHIGSGHTMGANLDAVVLKSAAGLPYIPGKTVKGLFREAILMLEQLGHLGVGATERFFGTTSGIKTRFETEPGILIFSDATLPPEMEKWANDHPLEAQMLYRVIPSTSINEKTGIAKKGSLRRIEVAVPVKLSGIISLMGGKELNNDVMNNQTWISVINNAAGFIRHLGTGRHRGLGRVRITVEEVTK